jgi:hypothetical protein
MRHADLVVSWVVGAAALQCDKPRQSFGELYMRDMHLNYQDMYVIFGGFVTCNV